MATISSKEFINLRVFNSVCQVLMNPAFWKWAFVMCRGLYAPMQVLCLADQKSPAMDKLNYYVLQTDRMLAMYCKDAEECGDALLTPMTIEAMDCSTSASFSDDSGSEPDEDGESVDDDNDSDDSISVQSDTQNGNNDEIRDDDDNKQQVFMCLYIVAFI